MNIKELLFAAKNGDLEKLESLLESGNLDVDAANEYGITALFHAAKEGHYEIVKFLIDNGAEVGLGDRSETNALMNAARNGHYEIVKFLLKSGAEVNFASKDNMTALAYAIENGHSAVVKLLLENGANVDSVSSTYGFHKAAVAGQHEIVRLLLDHGTEVDVIYDEKTALRAAVTYGSYNDSYKIAKLLLAYGANVEARGLNATATALMIAADRGYDRLVELLLKNGADVHAENRNGKTALDFAKTEEIKEMLEKAAQEGRAVSTTNFAARLNTSSSPSQGRG